MLGQMGFYNPGAGLCRGRIYAEVHRKNRRAMSRRILK
jgi:hypothetical protein